MTLEYAVGASALAASWSGYLITFLNTVFPNLPVPAWLNNYPLVWEFSFRFEKKLKNYIFSPLAVIIIVVCTIVLFFGASESATFNLIMSVINIIIIIFVIVLGSFLWKADNWNNFFGPGESWKGFTGVLSGK